MRLAQHKALFRTKVCAVNDRSNTNLARFQRIRVPRFLRRFEDMPCKRIFIFILGLGSSRWFHILGAEIIFMLHNASLVLERRCR